jgi:pimeloyl-ACP methyl ester carboxylesterase
MFPEAYGAGVLTRLARLHGFIVASPAATGLSPARFERLIEHLKSLYPIDEARIYVVGHSMGAGLASGLARSHADKLAAVACLAGGRFGAVRAGSTFAPVLMLGARLDPIIPAARLEADARRAAELGVPVDYRTMPAWGHTLMVGESLPAAIDWLLSQRLAPRTPIAPKLPAEPPAQPRAPEVPIGNPPSDPPANDRNPDGVPAPEPIIHPTPRPPGL